MANVLIVDDDRFFLAILGSFVTNRLRMHPLLVQDGASALSLLEKEPVDLVLLDILMPGMDGLQVLRGIKDRHPSLPVIMVTGSEVMEHAVVALREGADDFIRKPPDIDELELSVTRVLTRVRVDKSLPAPRDTTSERRRQCAAFGLRQGQSGGSRWGHLFPWGFCGRRWPWPRFSR